MPSRRALEVLRAVRLVNRLITRERDPAALVRGAAAIIVEALGEAACCLVRTDGERVVDACDAGEPSRLWAVRAVLERGELTHCMRDALGQRRTVASGTPQPDCRGCWGRSERGGARRDVAVPLVCEGRVYGVLLVMLTPGAEGPLDERQLFEDLAADLAFALRSSERAAEATALQERLARIADAAPGMMFTYARRLDGTSCLPFATPAAHDLLGMSPEELAIGLAGWRANVHPDDLGALLASVEAAARDFTTWHFECRYLHPRKGLRWIEGWSSPLREADGSLAWHGFLLDVTERRRSVERIERLSRLYRALSDSNEAIARVGEEAALFQRVCDIIVALGDVRVASISAADETGEALVWRAAAGPVAVAGVRAEALSLGVPPLGQRSLSTEAYRGGVTVLENDYARSVERACWRTHLVAAGVGAAIALPLLRGGAVVGVLSIGAGPVGYFDAEAVELLETMAQNLSAGLDHAARERELRASEARYRGLLDSIGDVVATSDVEGTLTFVNRTIARFGWTPEELVGRKLSTLLHPDDRADVLRRRAEGIAGGGVGSVEYRIVDAHGITRQVRTTSRPILEDGRTVGLVAVITDLTQQRETEEQLRFAQKMEAVGRLAGGVAHDFNNLLSVIESYAELAIEAVSPSDPVREDLLEIRTAGRRAEGLTRQLLAFSRKELLKPQVFDLEALVGGMERMLTRVLGEDVELRTALSGALTPIKADPGQLEQAVLNLAINARDAMPEGGTLTISTTRIDRRADPTSPRIVAAGSWVRLSIADTGEGMDEATRLRIFEPFFTTKSPGKGTGLGLAMVYGIVQQSGGSITVHSEADVGTTFDIELPIVTEPVSLAALSQATSPPRRGVETVLVVEDEPAVRNLTRRILAGAGYTVLLAANASEALQLCEQQPTPIDLLLTDVVMPGMNGRALAERLLLARPGLKVMFMSGYADEALGERGALDPRIELLDKPFTTDALLRTVRSVIDRA